MRTGRCLCGEVRYAVDGPVRDIVVCHCIDCLGWAGGPWPASAARRTQITIAGGELLRWLASPDSDERVQRGSCSACGSALFRAAPGRDTVGFGAGTLDDGSGLLVAADVYVESAPPWDTARSGPRAYPGAYPADGPALAWR